MSSKESMDLGGSSRRRGSAPKAGSVWESRMKIDEVKGGIKVFNATDEDSAQNTQNSSSTPNPNSAAIEENTEIVICKNVTPKQSPIGMSGKRKTWKSESSDGSPVKIASLRSDLNRNLEEHSKESGDGIKRSPISIKKSSLRKVKSDSVDDGKNEGNSEMGKMMVKAKAVVDEKIKNSDGDKKVVVVDDDEREKKPRSDEECGEVGVCEEIKATVTSNVARINGEDEPDFDKDKEIEVENKSVDVKQIAVNDHKPKRIVIEENKLIHANQKSVPISPIIKRHPPAVNHARLFHPTPTNINASNSDNFHGSPRTNSKLQSFVDLVMWRDASKSAFVFGIGTFAIISSSYTRGLNISFISVLSYLGLVYLAAIFLFRSLISRESVENDNANQDCVIGEEEAIWVIKLLLPYINEFLLKLRALFSGDPATTMKLAVLLFILARCGSSVTIWTMAKLGFIGVFTVPKICSTYSSQITAYGTFWIRRFKDAWASCSHKKAVGFALFAFVWNLSSVIARIWAVFMLFVAFKHYQQSLIREGWAQDETTNGQDSFCQGQSIGGPRLGRRTTIPNTGKQKKMNLAEDSPVHSSSSDDFAAVLDAELDSASDPPGDSEEVPEDEESSDDFDDEKIDFALDLERVKRQKVELYPDILNPQSSSSQGESSGSLPKEEICAHPGFFAGMCMKCGQPADDDSAVPLKYIDKNLRLANDEMARLRDKDVKDLLCHRRKLYLVLDLDHTLLNSARLSDIKEEEEYLSSQKDALPDALKTSLFRLDRMHMMTKLRPFVHTFLEEASSLFEMYIYTMGERPYALEMAKLLDPSDKYFHSRIIAQGDCTQKYQKGLDIVLGQESTVLILDDTEAVWKEHKDNLILMDRYHFFASSCKNFGFNYSSLSQLRTDESETEGALPTVLKILQQIHSLFFDKGRKDNLEDRDVRQVLKTVRKEVLKDCRVVFTRVFPTNFTAEHHPLWRMAEQLGATCLAEADPSVTHVVSLDSGTDKSRWAVKEKKFLVNPGWIEASNYLWKKQPEEKYPVTPAKSK
ncbi:C-terminal domain phosphatase-like 4 [Perilla frutescens var. hirtella]|nr:C-terminal domain phosphatase-like 4 [Perilla frutescens var. frutescens]KAH6794396.1 C-terminal domain phosphatase-like 4 [Perilla frutescens var. hirtella]